MNFKADYILTQRTSPKFELLQNQYIEVDENGKISSISDYTNQTIDTHFTRLLIPGLTNAHSHGFQLMMRGKADNPSDFIDWVNTYLYPSVRSFDEH